MLEFIYGYHPVLNALQNNRVTTLICVKDSKPDREIASYAKRVKIDYWDKKAFKEKFPHQAHQHIAALCKPLRLYDESCLKQPAAKGLYLLLDSIQDPQNFGACIRNAAAYDCDGIIFTKRNVAPMSAVCCKAAAGTIEWIRLIRVANAVRALEQLKKQGYWVMATDSSAAQTITASGCAPPLLVIMGGEGRGVRRLLAEKSDYHCRIETTRPHSSLNVATATALCLDAIRRRQQREGE